MYTIDESTRLEKINYKSPPLLTNHHFFTIRFLFISHLTVKHFQLFLIKILQFLAEIFKVIDPKAFGISRNVKLSPFIVSSPVRPLHNF